MSTASRILRPSIVLGPCLRQSQRGFHISRQLQHNEQNPRSKLSSETPGPSMGQATYLTIAAAGLGLGGCFFYLMSGPAEAVQIPGGELETKNFSTKNAR